MKIILYIVFSASIILFTYPTNASTINDFPPNERFRLKSGEIISLPLELYDYQQLTLLGSVDLISANKLLESEDLQAVPLVQAPSRASVAIFFINYLDTALGMYQEVITTIEVEQQPFEGATPSRGYYVADIRVTKPLAKNVGKEVWGLPKRIANITYDEHGNGDIGASMKRRYSKKEIFTALCAGCSALPVFPDAQDFFAVTPYKLRRTWYRIITEAETSFRPFDPSVDSFTINPYSSIGAKLNHLQFAPEAWLIGHSVSGLTFKSNAPLTPLPE